MKFLAAYLLAALNEESPVCAEAIKKIVSAVGIDFDQARVDLLMKELKDKKVADVIAEGSKKLASVPSGGAVAAAPAAGAAAPAAGAKKVPYLNNIRPKRRKKRRKWKKNQTMIWVSDYSTKFIYLLPINYVLVKLT